jgi:hypothetical protein
VGIADEPCPTVAGENTNTCPAGTVGVPYTIQFKEAEGSGCGPGKQKFTVDSGTFPPGLSLASSGHVSGTPTQAGSFEFYIKIAEPLGEPGCAGRVLGPQAAAFRRHFARYSVLPPRARRFELTQDSARKIPASTRLS